MSAADIVPSSKELVDRYRATYGLDPDVALSIDQVELHLRLERQLTKDLLQSAPEERWEVFDRSYTELYRSLPWLKSAGSKSEADLWLDLVGGPGSHVYEVGSGAGVLAQDLAARGCVVTATDVSRERGDTRPDTARLSWAVTDGVHLDRFAMSGAFDAVISDQVVEHLHPDDIGVHLSTARALLKPDGRYVVRTPHMLQGPHDVSRVFGFARPVGMHLHEYTFHELVVAAKEAGYSEALAVFRTPHRLGFHSSVRTSRLYLRWLLRVERVLEGVPRRRQRKAISEHARWPVFTESIWLVLLR